MSLGRYAVARLAGRSVMVPGAVPGDLLEIELTAEHADYAFARLVRVVAPSPLRRQPPCPYAATCGGCDWQQISYRAQTRFKAELVAAAFRRALGVELDLRELLEPAAAEFGYRSRVRLKTGPGGKVGFYQPGSNSLVAIESCLVAVPDLGAAARLAKMLGRGCAEIEIVEGGRGQVLVADLTTAPRASELERVRRLLDGEVGGLILRGGGRREVVGDARVQLEAEPGCMIEADADLFSQVNRAQNLKLVATVMKLAEIAAGARVLDLFCGAGNLSLPAARRGAQVTGVECSALAIEAARANAARLGLDNTQFVAMHAAQGARFLAGAGSRPDLVILNPPRTGAADLMDSLLALRAQKLLYVSCNPATLARDLRSLANGGYRLAQTRAFDFFPNTHHVETVASALLT